MSSLSHLCMVIALLVISSEPVCAGWLLIDSKQHEGERVYVNSDAIRRNGHVVDLWVLMDFDTLQTVPSPSYLSVESHREVDCNRGRIRLLASTAFSGHMGTGEALYSYMNPKDEGIPIEAGSVAHALWKVICDNPSNVR
jgi:hypothetical protein